MISNLKINDLLSILSEFALVVEDGAISEDARNVVFECKDNKVNVMGTNKMITMRKYDINAKADKDEIFQVRCKELIQFLSVYKTLSTTTVEDVMLEVVGTKLLVSVKESDNNVSEYRLDLVPMSKGELELFTQDIPESESITFKTDNLKWITDNFNNGISSTVDMFGNAIFTEDRCIILNPSYTLVGVNETPIKDIRLSKKVMAFIKSVVIKNEEIEYRIGKRIYMKWGNVDCFLQYNSQLPPIQVYLDQINTERYISLNQAYLRDILKRVSFIKDHIIFDIDCNEKEVLIRNQKFKQVVKVTDIKNLEIYDNIRFKVMPDVLNTLLIGKNDDIKFSYNEKDGNTIIIISDSTDKWYSIMRVKVL